MFAGYLKEFQNWDSSTYVRESMDIMALGNS
jgi:hypothetical protein